jgi:hypothetical protein
MRSEGMRAGGMAGDPNACAPPARHLSSKIVSPCESACQTIERWVSWDEQRAGSLGETWINSPIRLAANGQAQRLLIRIERGRFRKRVHLLACRGCEGSLACQGHSGLEVYGASEVGCRALAESRGVGLAPNSSLVRRRPSRTLSNKGRHCRNRLARITQSHSGSNFFQPPA